jgi:hypothetical protein
MAGLLDFILQPQYKSAFRTRCEESVNVLLRLCKADFAAISIFLTSIARDGYPFPMKAAENNIPSLSVTVRER